MPRPPVPRVGEVLAWGRGRLASAEIETADLDAQLLLAQALNTDRARLFSSNGKSVEKKDLLLFEELIEKRCCRVPVAFLVGRKEFFSLDLAVNDSVLIPRPETEGVVEAAVEMLDDGCRVLDLGTGSGNILVALAGEVEGTGWTAVDLSEEALRVARHNLVTHDLTERISLVRGDLFQCCREGELFDAVLSNPPYIPSGEIPCLPPEVGNHEPLMALDGGVDGLEVIAPIIDGAPRRLRSKGMLIMEIGAGQAADVAALARAKGDYGLIEVKRDLAGIERVLVARKD